MEEIEFYLAEAKESMEKALQHLDAALLKIRAGKASPAMLGGINVEYYGSMTPLAQVSSISVPDARSLVIKPFEKSLLQAIETAIINSDVGLNPMNDGDFIRISVPALTEERRMDLVKQTRGEGENGKIRVRTIRKDVNNELKNLLKDGASEDTIKGAEDSVQTMTDDFTNKIDAVLKKKEEDIMTI